MWGKVSLMLIYSLMISDAFVYLLTIYVFFGKKFFCLFLISLFFFYSVLWVLLWILTLYHIWFAKFPILSVQFSSVTQLCPTLCDPMNCSMPGLPVHHQLLEFTQTLVHRVGDAIHSIGYVLILLMFSLLVWNVLVWCSPSCLWLLLLPLFLVSNPKNH